MTRLHLEPGRVWSFDELPPRSIALDGAVRGPRIDAAGERYSFDHHEGVIRHVTLATCEQVREALLVGLDPRGFRVFLNDLDGDTLLSAWLLLHPERLRGKGGARVSRLVDRVGRSDALGPGRGRPHPLHVALTPGRDAAQTEADLERGLALLDAWWEGSARPRPPPATPAEAFWLDSSGALQRGWVDRMVGLYRVTSVGVLHGPAPGETRAYTIGKRSEFVEYDVPAFLRALDALEPGWGGGSTVGGAPRARDGARSRLSVEQVAEVFVAHHPRRAGRAGGPGVSAREAGGRRAHARGDTR
jgi:hypothetical protein